MPKRPGYIGLPLRTGDTAPDRCTGRIIDHAP